LPAGRYVRLIVTDTGRGFDQTVARRLFEPFFTTRPEGTGLGLATVQEIVRDHEGEMDVQSIPGRGSRFEAWLPAAPLGVDRAAPARPIGRGQAIMVVESERERLLQDEEMLAALGFEPVGFEHAADALGAFRADPDRFDAVIVAQAAPGSGGLALARAMHQAEPSRPILLAAPPSAEVGFDALADAGITEILRRPLVAAELAAVLARSLRRTPLRT
jgi:CheY-like chemotaxis protein